MEYVTIRYVTDVTVQNFNHDKKTLESLVMYKLFKLFQYKLYKSFAFKDIYNV